MLVHGRLARNTYCTVDNIYSHTPIWYNYYSQFCLTSWHYNEKISLIFPGFGLKASLAKWKEQAQEGKKLYFHEIPSKFNHIGIIMHWMSVCVCLFSCMSEQQTVWWQAILTTLRQMAISLRAKLLSKRTEGKTREKHIKSSMSAVSSRQGNWNTQKAYRAKSEKQIWDQGQVHQSAV